MHTLNKGIKLLITKRRAAKFRLALALIATAFVACATTASAIPVVSVEEDTENLTVVGGSEASTVSISHNYVNRTDGDLSVDGTQCFLVTSHSASCFGRIIGMSVDLGGGSDTVTVGNSVPAGFTAIIRGAKSVSSGSVAMDVVTDGVGTVTGGPRNDDITSVSSSGCPSTVDGGGGDDTIHVEQTGTSNPATCPAGKFLSGGDGDDLVDAKDSTIPLKYKASAGHDVFFGGSNGDHITVGDGPDWAFGGDGADRFYDNGGPDPSKLWGGPGNDTYTDWDPDESDITFFDGGSGFDQVAYHVIWPGYNVSVSLDDVANDGVDGESDNIESSVEGIGTDPVYGDNGQFGGDDVLTGNEAPNEIHAGPGEDAIFGLGGDDLLYGNAGADHFDCGAGDDTIWYDSSDTWEENCENTVDAGE